MIGTGEVVQAAQAQQERSRIHDTLNREDVGAKLVTPVSIRRR